MAREYYLISKNYGQSFIKYKGNAIRLSRQLPYIVDEVVVGVKGKIGQERRITTFKDSKGNIIERIFDYFDKPLKNQIYTEKDFIKGKNLSTTSTSITEYSLKRKNINRYITQIEELEKNNLLTFLWDKLKIENNHLYENINTGEKIFSRTSVTNMKQPTKQIHSFIEFPHIIDDKRQNNPKKILEFSVNSKQGLVTDILTQQGVQKPKKDSFLAFRALDIRELKTTLTQFFIKKRGLSRMDIYIDPEYNPKGESTYRIAAEFDSANGFINFNRLNTPKSKPHLVSTSRHEVEHAWQFYLYSRHTGGRYNWEMETAKKFGQIRKTKLKKEAQKYTKSIDNYVSYLENYEKYRKNYIEMKAYNIGHKTRNKYEKEAQEIRELFPYIPEEML